MEQEVLQTVLTELLQELKEVRQQQAETAKALLEVKNKVGAFEQRLSEVKVAPPKVDTQFIAAAVDNGLSKIRSVIEAQPKSVTKEFRVLLFPQYNAGEYYRLVFGKALFWMLMFLIATYLYFSGREFIERN
jgi:hypothetical protein